MADRKIVLRRIRAAIGSAVGDEVQGYRNRYRAWRWLAGVGRHYRRLGPGDRDEAYTAAVLADATLALEWRIMAFLALRALAQHSPPRVDDDLHWLQLGRLAAMTGRTAESIRIAEHLGAIRAARIVPGENLPDGLLATARGRSHVALEVAGLRRLVPNTILLDMVAAVSRWVRPLPVWMAAEVFPILMLAATQFVSDRHLANAKDADAVALSPYPLVRWWRRRGSRALKQVCHDGVHLSMVSTKWGVLCRVRTDAGSREHEVGAMADWTPTGEAATIVEQNIAYRLFDFHVESRLSTREQLCAPGGLLRMAGAIIQGALAGAAGAQQHCPLVFRTEGTLAHVPWAAAFRDGRFLVETNDIAFDDGLGIDRSRKRLPRLAALAGPSAAMRREAAGAASLAARAGMPAASGPLTSNALKAALTDASVVHLCTHFRAHPHDPEQGEIQMADGHWIRISDLDHDLEGLELLFLAGCETGTELDMFDGPGGNLVQPWRRAGVQTVISTLWRIEDHASEQLALSFYSHLVAGAGCATALADAQRAALASPLSVLISERFLDFEQPAEPAAMLAHPRQWAAFRLTGSPEPISRPQ